MDMPFIQTLVVWAMKKLLTADVIKGSEVELLVFLRSLAAKSSEATLINGAIDVLAVALGVAA